MNPLNLNEVTQFIETEIGVLYKRRLDLLASTQLAKIVMLKNPYVLVSSNITTAYDVVKNLLDAYLSSQEETIFGEFLEQLAIFVNEQVYGGKKSTAEGIHLEFNRDGVDYIVSIKSGPNWGNSGQISKMKENFRRAIRIKKTGNRGVNIQAINGCCYGIDNHPEKDEYTKLCGQRFWEFISGNRDLYIQIIEPLGHKAKEKNEEFSIEYGRIINVFEAEFLHDYCPDGRINWEKLVRLNSGTI